jgi:2-polyprenyl-3-methyl-5-hydroxy-6-metoxy-1,4-benzoquinol methylase
VARLWDDSLYAGSAEFYLKGRLPYPERLADVFRRHLSLDGTGRLLDLGCGPGSLSLLLAPLFDEVLAVDADADMIRVGQATAASRAIRNVTWRHAYAEDLDDVGRFRVVTLAQSFHWMDRPVVAVKIRGWLRQHGYCVHVGAATHEGTGATGEFPYPAPPRDRIRELVEAYLGPERRAGQGVVAAGYTSAIR